jgi:TRAP-type uncharacterized transport system substrate-binding protein
MTDDAVKQVLTLLWDGHDNLVRENQEFATWSTARMPLPNSTIPYHPASIEFFRTKGIDLSK